VFFFLFFNDIGEEASGETGEESDFRATWPVR